METTDPNQTHDFDEVRDRAEAYVRDEPTKAVGLAVLAGIFLTSFLSEAFSSASFVSPWGCSNPR
jgi:ElaB/YqjD/DUF883 family membrane-anchored ribosome-binding protein